MEPSFSEEDRRDAQLEAIFRTHVADLYRYIYRQIHNAVIAEDLTSAVFLKALRWLQEDRSSDSVKGWLRFTFCLLKRLKRCRCSPMRAMSKCDNFRPASSICLTGCPLVKGISSHCASSRGIVQQKSARS
jgi:hypothetical protein